MNEQIGSVLLNYDFYRGTDIYSDGNIEDTLLQIVKECKNTDDIYENLMTSDEWAVLYHLSPIRHNLLEWYGFHPQGNILEIGAGCGALTGLFCEKLKEVTALDLSKKRSLINAYRNQDNSNLEIIVGNIEDIQIDRQFSYVSLIGVLEYAASYINSREPFADMLKKAGNYLKPGGRLLLAVENKYGLKYWAGASEDHTGQLFDGIQGYKADSSIRTFSKETLTRLLKEAGFCEWKFYYPMPDYKMPFEIYSEDYLPKRGSIKSISPAYDRERLELFDEVQAFDSLCEDGLFEQFANSFLVIAG